MSFFVARASFQICSLSCNRYHVIVIYLSIYLSIYQYLGSAVVRAVALHHFGLVCQNPEVTSWWIEFGFQKTVQSELCEDLQINLFI